MDQKSAATASLSAVPDPTAAARALGQGLTRTLQALGPGRILALGAVALVILGFFALVIMRATAPGFTLLFAGLAPADAQRLLERLDGLEVPYRLSPQGDAIMVPSEEAPRLRMSLAEEGMPLGEAVGYEIFDQASPFGTTDFLSNVNYRRAVEGELARSIASLRPVRTARVHLVQPKRELFAREAVPSTASVVLGLTGGAELDKRQIEAIRQLMAAAVPGLVKKNVTLVDDRGQLLASAGDDDDPASAAGEAEDHRAAFEARLKGKIVQLLERTIGTGRVDAEVSADFDFGEVATTAETYDPESQVARSTQSTEESVDNSEQRDEETVTVANNLPTERDPAAAGPQASERTRRTEETVNYEISRTVRNETRRGAQLRRLSVAVQVDGIAVTGADGAETWAPRSRTELDQIAGLVRTAAGIDEKRGDTINVVSRRFVASAPGVEPETTWLGLDREDYWRLGELGTFAALTLLVLFVAVRPALRRLLPGRETAIAGTVLAAVATGADGKPVTGVDAAGVAGLQGKPAQAAGSATPALSDGSDPSDALDAMVDLRQVRGQVRASLVNSLAKVIDQRPEEAVRVVRGWLQDR